MHYVYAARRVPDTGDILYQRSTDNGATRSTPIKVNTDTTTRAQWMPSLISTAGGALLASWYDRRNTTNNNYERYWASVAGQRQHMGRFDDVISDVVYTSRCSPTPTSNRATAVTTIPLGGRDNRAVGMGRVNAD